MALSYNDARTQATQLVDKSQFVNDLTGVFDGAAYNKALADTTDSILTADKNSNPATPQQAPAAAAASTASAAASQASADKTAEDVALQQELNKERQANQGKGLGYVTNAEASNLGIAQGRVNIAQETAQLAQERANQDAYIQQQRLLVEQGKLDASTAAQNVQNMINQQKVDQATNNAAETQRGNYATEQQNEANAGASAVNNAIDAGTKMAQGSLQGGGAAAAATGALLQAAPAMSFGLPSSVLNQPMTPQLEAATRGYMATGMDARSAILKSLGGGTGPTATVTAPQASGPNDTTQGLPGPGSAGFTGGGQQATAVAPALTSYFQHNPQNIFPAPSA